MNPQPSWSEGPSAEQDRCQMFLLRQLRAATTPALAEVQQLLSSPAVLSIP